MSEKRYMLTDFDREVEMLEKINEQQAKIEKIEKENRELNSIKKFAEKNGINIFLIEEAFRKCWKDNGKLFEENEQLEKGKMEALSLLGEEIDKNEQLRQTMQKVCELLEEEVDLFSDKATEHDVIAYREMQDFDNKDAYYICTATKKAIQMLKGRDSDERARIEN